MRTLMMLSARVVLLVLSCDALQRSSLAAQDPLEQPVVVAVPDSSSYGHRADIPYAERGDRVFLMDVFTPLRDRGGGFPAVLFVHGGPLPPSVAPQGKDLAQYQSWAAYLTAAGLGAVAFSHGFSDPETFQAASRDVAAAVAHVRDNAERWQINGDRMCMVFVSAGGSLVAPLLSDRPSWLKCVVLYYPMLRPQTLQELGAGEVPQDQRVGLDPFPYIASWEDGPPELFVVEAGQDRTVINQELRQFRDAAVASGWSVEYWNHPAGPHGFDVFDSSERSRTIIRRTREFLAEQLLLENH